MFAGELHACFTWSTKADAVDMYVGYGDQPKDLQISDDGGYITKIWFLGTTLVVDPFTLHIFADDCSYD